MSTYRYCLRYTLDSAGLRERPTHSVNVKPRRVILNCSHAILYFTIVVSAQMDTNIHSNFWLQSLFDLPGNNLHPILLFVLARFD